MKLFVCAVFDTAAQMFGTPIFLPSTGAALRSFGDEINRDEKDNPLFNHSSDFEIYVLGQFDSDTGLFSGEKKLLARGVDMRIKGAGPTGSVS